MSTNPHECIRNAYLNIDPNLMRVERGMNVVSEWYHVAERTHMAEPYIFSLRTRRRTLTLSFIVGFRPQDFGSMIFAFVLPPFHHPLL